MKPVNFFMDREFTEVLQDVLALDHESQMEIVETVMAASQDYDLEWREEARRRELAYQRGEITTVDSKDVMERARRKIAEARSRE